MLSRDQYMCGIVGYLGSKEASPILLKGLHRLEYRGYDSAGVSFFTKDGALSTVKRPGKIVNLEEALKEVDTASNCGIAHTRWATHGQPNQLNAHPHLSMDGDIALVSEGNEEIADKVDHIIRIPEADPMTLPVLATVPLQLLSYHMAMIRGCDVDHPRNLAKSVTVE
jgi:glucosamine 6-phosphate synthetase-like amidotransferase/phosphosugar isomerase protein